MKKVLCAFKPFAVEITQDLMLCACLVGPIFMGVVFRFAVPVIEGLLCEQFSKEQIMAPYYVGFDMLLAVMTPIMFCFAGVLVVLEEIDCGTAKYYSVTPLGRQGYLISRIAIPALFAFLYDGLIVGLFKVSDTNGVMVIMLCICGTLIAVVTSMFVIAFAKNKIEGMALVKMSGLLIVGIPVAYFVVSPVRYCFGVLPTFWMAELCIAENSLYFMVSMLTAGIMIFGLYGRFRKKMM